jgi:hypothetical protein
MPVPRSLYLAVGAAAAPASLCAGAMVPVAGVLAGTIAVGLVLLVTAAGALLAADWRTEAESRQAWAEVAPRWAEWKAGVRRQSADIDTRYLAASEKEALRRVFCVHRVLPSQAVAVMELPAAGSASQPALTQLLCTRMARECSQRSASDRGSDAGASVRDDLAGRTTFERSRAAKSQRVAAGGGAARSTCVAGGTAVRLAVNAGPCWQGSGRAEATPSHGAEVVVLASRRDAQHARPADAVTVVAADTRPPSCRGPPSPGRQRSARSATTMAGCAAPPPRRLPDGDLVVRDNLGQPVPICAAEVAVIETYLGDALEELFASSKANSEPERA